MALVSAVSLKGRHYDDLLITAGILGDTKLIDWDVNASIYVNLALPKPSTRV